MYVRGTGVPVKKHVELIQTERPNIIVGTPGRVLDLANRADGLDLSKVKFFVLDECDKILESGACGSESENVHALKGLACRKRVAPASSTLAAAPGLLAHALVTKQ